MTGQNIVTWDDGRLAVNAEFVPLLEASGLVTVSAFMDFSHAETVKSAVTDRRTDRICLTSDGEDWSGFLKRHRPPRWSESLKAWVRLTRPIHGARGEWEALWQFHEAGLPTMTPVAFGESQQGSFVLTESLEPGQKLTALSDETIFDTRRRRELVKAVGTLTRRMHAAGMHHQDFYLGHLMCRVDQPQQPVFVLDLGRARQLRRLGLRWIVKDLAQLLYSARHLTAADRMRCALEYLGRRPHDADRQLFKRVTRKSEAIARHSRKHQL